MHKLYLAKTAAKPVISTPLVVMKYLILPFLKNQSYYRIEDGLGNLVEECVVFTPA